MFFRHNAIGRAAVAPMGLGWILALAGCANPGQPRPPSLHLPEKAQQVAAERVGDQVIVTWTTPAKTTDKDPIRGDVVAVVCRDGAATRLAGAAHSVGCDPVQRIAVGPGPSRAVETLPASLSVGQPSLLTYRVELLNAHDRSAGRSDPAFAAAGAAPPAAGPLKVTAQRDGALVTWMPVTWPPVVGPPVVGLPVTGTSVPGGKTADLAPMRLTRTLVGLLPEAKPAPVSNRARPLGFNSSNTNPAIAHLESPPRLDADSGGLIDRGPQNGATYRYVAERVRRVSLAGHTLELHGMPSPGATFTYRDVFPPKPPTGLVSVPGGGFGEALSIDLSWDANREADVEGYNVYRADQAAGSRANFIRLNAEPIPSSAFRDGQVEPGHSYVYRVTAVDRQHNESAPGDERYESLRK